MHPLHLPVVTKSLANGRFALERAAQPSPQRPAGQGRDATDTYSGSSPESRRWRFASRKLPLADESSRPEAVDQHPKNRTFNV